MDFITTSIRVTEGDTEEVCLQKDGLHQSDVVVLVETCLAENTEYDLATGELPIGVYTREGLLFQLVCTVSAGFYSFS